MPKAMKKLVAVPLAISLSACAALHHPPPMPEPARSQAQREKLPRWIVGIREPVVRYSDPKKAGPDVMDEVRDAAHLITLLRATGIFADVDFTGQLRCPADIEVVVHAREDDPLRPAPVWLWPVTLSLVILKDEEGVTFSSVSDPNVVFEFPYPTTMDVGILPLVASPFLLARTFPTWTLAAQKLPRDGELRLFLLSNADRLREFAKNQVPGRCPSARSE